MSYRNVSRIGLALVVLGVMSVVFWWLIGGAPEAKENGGVPVAAREATAATPSAPATPVSKAASDASDRSDTSDKAADATRPAALAPATPTTPATAPAPAAIAASIARFVDASLPVAQRMAEIGQLGQRGEADAVQTLMKLGDTYTYLNFAAVEALGNVKTPEVARYLEGKTGDKDPKIVVAAMQSLAHVQGTEAIPAIAATLAANRQRPDGFQDTVCAAGVKALGEIGSPLAIPVLAEEFEKTVGKTLQHEYGSQVVAAFKAIGDPAGVPALEAYALRLQTQRDGMDKNPMGQHYLEGKIKEVREAIAALAH